MAKFIAKCENQVLCMVPNRATVQDGIIVTVPGKHIRFEKGEYDTTDKKEIEFIQKHPLFGSRITVAEDAKESKK